MLPAIGEAAMHHTVRANYESEMHDQDLAVKKSDQIRQKRPVENTEDSSRSEMNLKQDEETTRKNKMEENGTCQKASPTGIRARDYKSELLSGVAKIPNSTIRVYKLLQHCLHH